LILAAVWTNTPAVDFPGFDHKATEFPQIDFFRVNVKIVEFPTHLTLKMTMKRTIDIVSGFPLSGGDRLQNPFTQE
jgi:hypothetical protein